MQEKHALTIIKIKHFQPDPFVQTDIYIHTLSER